MIEVLSPDLATVQYLEQSSARKDFFKWPRVDDVAQTAAHFVFEWDFEVVPVSRSWNVPAVDELQEKYDRIASRLSD